VDAGQTGEGAGPLGLAIDLVVVPLVLPQAEPAKPVRGAREVVHAEPSSEDPGGLTTRGGGTLASPYRSSRPRRVRTLTCARGRHRPDPHVLVVGGYPGTGE